MNLVEMEARWKSTHMRVRLTGLGRHVHPKHDVIPPELSKALYRESLQLHAKGFGADRIATQLSSAHSLRVAPGTISHWIAGNRRPGLRNIFKAKPSRALSYIIGANLGDGSRLVKTSCVKLEVTDLEFAQAFNSKMAKLFSRDVPNKIMVRRFETGRLPLYIVRYVSRQLINLLMLPRNKLFRIAFAYPRDFLRGFFDAEGHVDVAAGNSFSLAVGAENSNRTLLVRIRQILQTEFKINSTILRKRRSGTLKVIRGQAFLMRQTSFSLMIRKLRDLKTFGKQVGFSISRKNQKLRDALIISENHPWKKMPIEWRQLYIKQRGEWVRR